MRNDFESNYLQHWGIQKGAKRKNHKYFERIERNGRYIYFYTQQQYDAFLKKMSGAASKVKNTLSGSSKQQNKTSEKKEIVTYTQQKNRNAATIKMSLSLGTARIEQMRQTNFKFSGNTAEEKKKNAEMAVAKGEEEINKNLNKTEDSSKSSKKSSSSKSSSGSSSKKKGSSSGSKKSSSSKEKSSGSKAASKSASTTKKNTSNTGKTTASETANKQTNDQKITLDTLKKVYGKEDKDVSAHSMSEVEFENEMLKKYDEGSFGYVMAGGNAYKWTIENGQLIIKDYDTDKEISAKEYLKDVKEFKEFQTNKKKSK